MYDCTVHSNSRACLVIKNVVDENFLIDSLVWGRRDRFFFVTAQVGLSWA